MIYSDCYHNTFTCEELEQIAAKVRSLSDHELDQLWYGAGFIISGREKKYKAIRQVDITAIRESQQKAAEKVLAVLLESNVHVFKKILYELLYDA